MLSVNVVLSITNGFSILEMISGISQLEKASWPMLVMELGIVTEVRLLQRENALLPILVTLLGIVIDVRLRQPQKASFPMLVTPLGIVMDVRP